MAGSKVYMTRELNQAGLMKAFQALGVRLQGKVAVKISSGEPGGHNFLDARLIKPLVDAVNGTIVECNTAYPGGRFRTEDHYQVMRDHGFADIAPVEIMDGEGEFSLPIDFGRNMKEDIVGIGLQKYDAMVNLAHFKGHMMGGFGGVIKNMSIGVASSAGKALIHSAGRSADLNGGRLDDKVDQDAFLEAMAESAKSVHDYLGGQVLYIDVMNRLSVDCDCDSDPAEPTMKDIGILSSLDPVALDQACVDLVYAAPDGQDLIQRMESRHGIHTVEWAAEIGYGSREYELIDLDQ